MSNAHYKQSLEQEVSYVIGKLSNVNIINAQTLMDEGSELRQLSENMKSYLIQNGKPELLAQLENAAMQAESVLRLSVLESQWGIFGLNWSPNIGYLKHLVRMKAFLDNPQINQSKLTAKYWSPNEERHLLHDKLYSFEDSLSKNLVRYTEDLKKISSDRYLFNQYFCKNMLGMKRLCQLLYWLIDNEISAYPTNFMERLDWLAGKCQVYRQRQTTTRQ